VLFNGQQISGRPAYEIAALGIGYVPEHRAVFRDLTVEENLKIAERAKNDFAKKADFLFELFPDLKKFYKHSGGQLSGGQQQMLSIARALVADNSLLLIDEPSEGLAPVIVENIIEALRRLSDRVTVLLVEQNFRMASMLADRYYLVDDGRTVYEGVMKDLVGNKELIAKYLGAG
jgi:branched-chain amino acid transport system ATP-binding protein